MRWNKDTGNREEKSSFHRSYLRWALEHYQILHLPRTVHLESNRSEEFFLRVCNAALDHLDSLIQSHRGVKWEHNNPQTWAKDLDLISTARTNLAFAVLSASIDEAIHRVPEIHQGDARKAVNDFLSDYSHDALNALTKNRGELSDTLSRHLCIKNVHLLSALSDLGLVLRSDHDALHYRWAHRDLTMMGMLTPSLMQQTSEAFKEILDSAQEEGWELVLTNAPLVLTGDSRRGSTSNQQFHRKSGHSLSFAEPMFTKDLYALIYKANFLDSPLHVRGTPWDGIEPYEKRTDGMKLFLEWATRQTTAKSEGYDGPGVNTLFVLNSISSPKMLSLINKALANHSHDFQGKAKATTTSNHQIIRHILPNRLRFTEEQQDIIDKTNSSLPLIFKGPPGTGKTWLGTEILLGHANKWNAQAWIITLNSHLADEIRDNIPEHQKTAPFTK